MSIREIQLGNVIFAQEHDGERLRIFDRVEIPQGWVVNGGLPTEIFGVNISNAVIPLMPGGNNLRDRMKAQIEQEHVRNKYGEGAFRLLIVDDKTTCGFSSRYVLPEDLQKNPKTLAEEMSKALNDGDTELSEMKRCAFMAISGWTNTK